MARVLLELEEGDGRNLFFARGGPATEHRRPSCSCCCKLGARFARGEVLDVIFNALRTWRITVPSKRGGGVRGVVFGDMFRRLVVRTLSQLHFSKMNSRPGSSLQGLCELNIEATITSIDGIQRDGMPCSVGCAVDGGSADMLFVRLFYGSTSTR